MKNILLVAVLVALSGWGVHAEQVADRSVRDGVYTMPQADRGQTVYDAKCELCHGSMASVTPDLAPLLNDYAFQTTWRDRSLLEFFERTRDTMPQDEPGTLSSEELVDLIAYILSANRMPAGEVALIDDAETLRQIRLDVGGP